MNNDTLQRIRMLVELFLSYGRRASRVLARYCLLFLLALSPCAIAWADVALYVSPLGDDKNDGSSGPKAVATLQAALKLAEPMLKSVGTINIIVLGGRYLEQRFQTTGNVNQAPIVIVPSGTSSVIFDGNGKGGTWMTLTKQGKGGIPSNITMANFEVTNYETAIDATADRNDKKAWIGGMTIHNMTFSYIGDIANANATEASTAVIRLVNSQGNQIIRSRFENIRNRTDCPILHAVYLAHYSVDNLIENTYFSNICGDAVRFRDESGPNTVKLNTFKDSWSQSPTSDWFCDKTTRTDCTKTSGECPSIGNKLTSNTMETAGTAPLPPLFIGYFTPPASCPAGPRAIIQ
ncbi:hypothetical protein [Bordetella sp. LUAb4]|uniref:hypothetical protein n=1 Tax=Bordetella sp. LUAb4 TaxID=2843195 RepID=UPI001E2BFB08|nr:hypothetical protein [Bordetella sp. LUAb4]